MGLFFEPHHEELAGALAAAPAPDEAEPREALRGLGGDRGPLRWLVPGPGAELDVRALCLIRERLAYDAPLADALFAVQGLAAHPLWSADRGAWADVLDGAARGDEILAFALTEPEAGSDAAALATRAEPTSGGYRLTGEKTLISSAPIATRLLVFAKTDPDAGGRGVTAFLLPAGAEGVAIRPGAVTVDHPIGDVSLRGAFAPAEAVVGEPGQGLKLAMRALERLRVAVGAAAAGMARRALDEALAHAGARRQFGAPLADQPVIQASLADMATELDAARLLVYRAARDLDVGAGSAKTSAMAKLYATEAAQRIVDRAVQIHGGLGVTRDHVVERLYRAIRPLRIYEGTSEIQRVVIARELADKRAGSGARRT